MSTAQTKVVRCNETLHEIPSWYAHNLGILLIREIWIDNITTYYIEYGRSENNSNKEKKNTHLKISS